MAKQNSFLLRIDPKILEALKKWADDDLRSVNGQIEFLLRDALIKAKRYTKSSSEKNNIAKNENPNEDALENEK